MPDFHKVHTIGVNGKTMAWRDSGTGPTIVFVHGNPTSSYLWRNVVPHLDSHFRCIAPDLIGMGESEKLEDHGPRTYSYFVHRDYFDGWMDVINLRGPIVFVGHNWGVPLTMDWAMRRPDQVAGIVHMEGQISPVTTAIAGDRFQKFNAHMHSPEMEADVLNTNLYLEQYFFRYVEDILTATDRAAYEKPFANSGPDRRPTLDWPCEIPVDGAPADIHERLVVLKSWMVENALPKLWLVPDDASIMTGERLATAESFSCQTKMDIVGGHYTPETSPEAVGRAISDWIEKEL